MSFSVIEAQNFQLYHMSSGEEYNKNISIPTSRSPDTQGHQNFEDWIPEEIKLVRDKLTYVKWGQSKMSSASKHYSIKVF